LAVDVVEEFDQSREISLLIVEHGHVAAVRAIKISAVPNGIDHSLRAGLG
jgi:hypothetical protein